MNSPSVSTFSPGQLVRWSADPLGSWRSLMVCEHDGWSSDTAIVSPVGQYYIPDNDEIFMVVSFTSNRIQFPHSNELYFGAPRAVLVHIRGQLS